MQFYWDGAYTVGWPSGLYIGVLGFQGAKPLFRPIVLAQAVSSLPVEPDIYDAVHSLKKKPHEADQVYQRLTRDLFFPNSFLMFIYQLTNIEFLQ